ncbi:2OG-Fe dioxygenase family protein [Xylophilus sp.]|uniref:2OG-Fe dioxygenase family protein n=1 Tax=Xylophilus sp. TaxID=2653893 RepID=UPI0013BBE5FA|nr:2OG-Fe dioxygenase family protein [Xylophilus sp.]KAF1044013.1 MAG: hypothetical protein GAK38_03723 [Xylophilus sp.]
MPTPQFAPPFTPAENLNTELRQRGFAVLDPQGTMAWIDAAFSELQDIIPSWNDLMPDRYLRDGGRYRRRRHACFVVQGGEVRQVPHRPHWQPVEYNALHGGMQRWFAPVEPEVVAAPVWNRLLAALTRAGEAVRPDHPTGSPWFIEAHQFRIDTTDGIGRPTPEGAHRDGVDVVAVLLVGRHAVKGGETRVFDAAGPSGRRFTLTEPGSVLLLDDARVIHESTPIQPLQAEGWRDTLVLTLRAGGFQGDGVDAGPVLV